MSRDFFSRIAFKIMFIKIDIMPENVYNNKCKGCGMMAKRAIVLLPKTEKYLSIMGEQIKLARLRRKLPVELVAKRAGVSRATVWKVEKGEASVAMGIYAAVLQALNNMDRDLLLIAKDDELGRKLQDLNLPIRKRAPKDED